jgi:CheY-like chemotaxis protein
MTAPGQDVFGPRGSVRTPQPARVLVAEDDSELRTLIVMALREDGYQVTEAVDGNELLDGIADSIMDDGRVGAFDLIVSDIQMPGFTALDILAGLRRTLSHTPVILITAFGDPLVRHKAERLGAVCVFDKPFDISDLRSAVVHALARRTTDNPLAPWPPHRSSKN